MVLLLLVCSSWAGANDVVQTARCIGGYAQGNAPVWEPLNDEDRQYVGPTDAEPGEWFLQSTELPESINNEKEFRQAVYAMAYNLIPEHTFQTAGGIAPGLVNRWLEKIGTSVYGQVALGMTEDKVILKVLHTADSRVLAAFRNPAMESRLVGKERDVLNTCSQWIASNLRAGMPNGLKLKKIHDALVDNSKYTKGCHSTAEIVLEGKGVCSAYTSAAQLLLHMVRIDCLRVYSIPAENHVWNLVEINGDWYHMDVTWDDPLSNTDQHMFEYFLRTDEEIAVDHTVKSPHLYERTPKQNAWHFHIRNDVKRSWVKGRTGYSLPKNEDESVMETMYNMYLKEAAARGEQIADFMGKDVVRKEKAEDKLKMGKDSDPMDVAKNWTRYAPKLKNKQGEKEEGISNTKEFNAKLEALVSQLDEKRQIIRFKKGTSSHKMREIVGTSDINSYAEKFVVVYDEDKSLLELEMTYWSHVRVLTAAADDSLVRKLTREERRALKTCQNLVSAMPQGPLRRKRQVVRDLHLELISKGKVLDKYSDMGEYVSRGGSHSLGYAQMMYVTLNLAEIPCILVHGRASSEKSHHDQVWNMVRLSPRSWYHVDAALDDENGNGTGNSIQYCLTRDDEMTSSHAWDRQETPITPTQMQKEMMKKMNPFNMGR